jgi:hypothetical protein
MDTIRILHHHEHGFGWNFESPDIPGLTGGGDAYDRAHTEEAAGFALVLGAAKSRATRRPPISSSSIMCPSALPPRRSAERFALAPLAPF